MANIVAAHPDVYIPLRETNIFRKDREQAAEGFSALLEEAEASGKRYLFEKTPRHVRRLPLIRSIVPGARFIVAMRDGRDVAGSYARRTGDPGLGVRQWIKSNSAIIRELDKGDVLVYRHEDLVDDTEGVLRRICEFATIPFDEAMLRYHENDRLWFGQTQVRKGTEHGKGHGSYRNWQVNQPVFDNRGQWRSVITDDDFPELLHGPGRELMKRFGYLE
jgi:hypothetical protein